MKNNFISINGKIVKEKDAKISVLDHGLLVGDGIFEQVVGPYLVADDNGDKHQYHSKHDFQGQRA